jgi:two-component system NtrC family response regulator
MDTILVVDDEANYLTVMQALLEEANYETLTALSGPEALKVAAQSDLDAVLTDMKMPKMSGIELMNEFKRLYPDIPVIIMTAYGTVERAVEAMKKGAFDYILKPFKNEEILVTIAKALEHRHLLLKNRLLTQDLEQKYGFPNIVGESKAIQEILALVKRVAGSKATVLVSGESGTGKELIARAIHQLSPRANKTFISVNCAALTETLLESELFGHERGAFTHAVAMRKGRFELADGGFWTKWRKCRRPSRSSSCVSSRRWSSSASAGPGPSKWTCGWWRPPTKTSRKRWKPAASGKTCTTA